MADANGLTRGQPGYDAASESENVDQPNAGPSQTPRVTTPEEGGGQASRPAPAPITPDVSQFDYSRIAANPGETADQTIARYGKDYHGNVSGDDSATVNAALASGGYQRYLAGKQAPVASGENYDNPASQLSSLASLIQQGGGWRGTTPEYFQQRINETGGFTPENIAYWKKMILGGYDAHEESERGGAQASGGGTAGNPALDDATNQAILDLLKDGGTPVDPNDPSIAGPVTAFRNQAQYGADRNREALAERAAFEGVGSGAFDTAIQSGNEKAAMDTASYAGQLTTQAAQLKLQKLQTALQFASGKDAQAIQLQIARLQDQLSRSQMSQQSQQFYDNMGYNIGKDKATFDYLYANTAGGN